MTPEHREREIARRKAEILAEVPVGRRPEVLRLITGLCRLVSEAGLTAPGKVDESGPRFESGAHGAAEVLR